MVETLIESTEKKYSFRKLNATDIASMCAVIGKIGINEFAKCFESNELANIINGKKNIKNMTSVAGMTVAFDIANIIISHIPDCADEAFTLLANVSGLKVDEIKAFDIAIFTEMIIDFVKKEEFKDFFKVVSKLFD